MTYRLDPIRKRRQRWEALQNKGHRFALCLINADGSTGTIQMSARHESMLRPFANWRPGLKLVEVESELAAIA